MNIPNLISLVRLFMVPLIVWLLLDHNYLWALITFFVAGISDLLDGMLARIMNCDTKLGQYMDPIADKVLLVGVFLTMGIQSLIPSWLVIIVVFRDIVIVGGVVLSLLFLNNNTRITPLLISKINTFMQIGLVVIILAQVAIGINLRNINTIIFICTAATTILSGIGYVYEWITNELNNGKK